MKRFLLCITTLFFLSSTLPGCSVYRAASQPDKKDLSVLEPGTRRELVIAELGQPVYSGKDGDVDYDIYNFVQGYSKGAKTGRAFLHGAADIFTLGLWEVVGNPIETAASGTKMKVKISYDVEKKVSRVENLEAQSNQNQEQAVKAPGEQKVKNDQEQSVKADQGTAPEKK